jgi:hypothetical protein
MGARSVRRELPWSWHDAAGWPGQLARTRRWLARVRTTQDAVEATDFLFAFFQSCYSLRDWLPPSFKRGRVLHLFNTNAELRLCRDLANMTKHRALKGRTGTGRQPSIAREYADEGRGWLGGDSWLVVLSRGQKIDALELADRCLRLVQGFVEQPSQP